MNNIEIDFGNDGFKIQADLMMDGDQWCVGVGKNLQQGIYAFGDTPIETIINFKDEFRNHAKPTPAPREVMPGTLDALSKLTIK